MLGKVIFMAGGHPSLVTSITVRSILSLINADFRGPKPYIATANDASRCRTVSNTEYDISPSFQLQP
jgi:hypothetical protein